jgi:hypothetical protein
MRGCASSRVRAMATGGTETFRARQPAYPPGAAGGAIVGRRVPKSRPLRRSKLRLYSITSSARASSVGGTSRPSALAVCRLMMNSNFVDCSTGKSAGLALEDLTGVGADLTIHARTIGVVAHQPAGFDSLATGIARGNPVVRRKRDKLDASAGKEHVASDVQGIGAVVHEGGESRLDLAARAGVEDLNLQSHCTGGFRYVSYALGTSDIGRIDQHGNANGLGHQLVQPASLRPLRNAAARGASDDPALTKATTGIVGCCARAASGHVAAAPPRSDMNWRRLIRAPRRRGRAGYLAR